MGGEDDPPVGLPSYRAGLGSKDGDGAADNNRPYQFGRKVWSGWPYPFAPAQFAHLLILRGRIQDGFPAPGRD